MGDLPSNAEVDRLGERLRGGHPTPADIQELDAWRRSFFPAGEAVLQRLRELGDWEIADRLAKSTPAIIAKLHRPPTTRLSQMQDIAGIRIVVGDTMEQESAARRVASTFSGATQFDRREGSTSGDRAIHFVARSLGKPVEIQLRTELQQLWAQWCERLADRHGSDVKYGHGPQDVLREPLEVSEHIARFEDTEMAFFNLRTQIESSDDATAWGDRLAELARRIPEARKEIAELLARRSRHPSDSGSTSK